MTIVNKAKENPAVSMLIMIATIAAGGTAVWAGIGLADQLHTTEQELLLYDLKSHTNATLQFNSLKIDIAAADTLSKCRDLRSQIRALTDSIYVRTRDSADPDYINELENQLEDLEDDYDALGCARKLA